ncbi:MAG TPA: serine/threonine-protein kinase [Myxococcaceae bacterium]|nr:serine/threonine-protein kinase [Myxococcaceae bacterium]
MGEVTLSTGETLTTGEPREPLPELIQVTFDRYRLVTSLGEGGMGEVWLAEQVEPIRRRVALKVIKTGMDTREVVARFESERQALAMMDHPAIAKVLDAGKTPEGRPYFVMEYVDGISITEHCDQHRLSTSERLELLAEVCDGVQHAHQKAVIHRDLKPSNILVTTIDGKAQPKVIDFGIAKAIGNPLSDRALLTEVGAVIGTPEYMSPEQADSTGQDIDTRTDVYSLGVILYQMLTGDLPFSSKELRSSSNENLRRILREREPGRPSLRLSTLGGDAERIASERSTDADSLARQLAGDLDAITLKAMEKDRSRRYGTATGLAEDIRRYLRHEPVLARPPSRTYRARKWLRRHRVGASVSAGVGVLLLAFAVSTTVQSRRTARERDRANHEAAAAGRVSDFLTRMFNVSDPSEARGNSITAREILDRAATDLETGRGMDPGLQARMMDTVGGVYANLGLYPRAASLFEKALEIRRRTLGPDHPDTLRTAYKLGAAYTRGARYTEADPLLVDTVARSERVHGPRHLETLTAMNNLANLRLGQGRRKEAEGLYRKILEGRRQLLGPEHLETITALNNLALILTDSGSDKEAEAMLREVVETRRRALGPEHPDTLAAMNNLGLAVRNAGRAAEAETIFRQTVEIRRRILGPEHPDTLGSVSNLANTLMDQQRAVEAEPLYRETLEIERRVLGPDHPHTFLAVMGLAGALSDQGHLREAETLDRELLGAQRRVLGPESPQAAMSEYNLAGLAARTARTREALDLLRQSMAHHLPKPIARQMGQDPDLAPLRGNPEFEAISARARAP